MSMDVTYSDLGLLQIQVAALTAEVEALRTENGTLAAQVERLEATAARTERHRVDL